MTFDDPESLDPLAFCRSLFPDRGYVDGPVAAEGWRTIAFRDSPDRPLIALKREFCAGGSAAGLAAVSSPIMRSIGCCDCRGTCCFFHAASVAIDGRGIMIVGPQGDRQDHHLDDVGLARARLPRRRDGGGAAGHQGAVSVSAGRLASSRTAWAPCRGAPGGPEILGRAISRRWRTHPGQHRRVCFRRQGLRPQRLSCVMFLRRFAERPAVEPFAFGLEHFRMLSPLACSMWGRSAGTAIMRVEPACCMEQAVTISIRVRPTRLPN